MQKWEYTYLSRSRGIAPSADGYLEATAWDPDVRFAEIQKLGEAGWELISISNSSRYGGFISSHTLAAEAMIEARLTPPVKISGPVAGGVTTEQTFYFKRPKQ